MQMFVEKAFISDNISFKAHTFSDAERVVTAGNEVIKRNKEVRVALRSPQQVLFGAPAYRLGQRRRVQSERPVQGFCHREREELDE